MYATKNPKAYSRDAQRARSARRSEKTEKRGGTSRNIRCGAESGKGEGLTR